eukprot:TRINITY_DN1188_c0_g2_i2.p1 TRINITY_DN1188_c0_g2~~TRINITY_DN1188_c0_g2_i2.p1  ORF type:complete len:1683 (-),score=415.80 TRINITY_DN1188_c0_g2_i2:354-4655(-)
MNELVTEKETKLRVGMRMMGLNNFVYWIVWQLFTTVIVILSSLILIVSGYICQFDYFKNTNFFVLFLMFFVYGVAVFNLAFLLSTLINRVKTSQTLGYSIILIGFVVQSILTGAYEYMILGFYSKSWGIWIRYILQFYPPFNFAKLYTDIAYLAGSTVSYETGQIIKGEGFKWGDLFKSIYINSVRATSPPPYQSLLYLLMNILIFWILTWYLDNAFPSEFGSNKKWYFPFTREYWGLRTNNDKTGVQRALSTLPDQNVRVDEDVRKEEIRAYEEENVAVRVINLQKKFESCLPCGGKEVKAVDGTSFVVEKGEVFCLLGHNGAGKTTTINMLTGLFEPSDGGASINGYDILTEMDSVRKSLGVCPQHDILWNEMTPYEHLHIFSTLKGVPKNQVESSIDQLLQKVNLLHVKNNHVGTFSGGMKRRLSVAISAIGDPEVIYFDEPSTGLDPVSRGHLWKLIEELKEDKAILLTTHSMEEADTLASRIGIMANGKMKCIGNSLHLKNKFGTGYTVNVSTEFHRSEQIIKQIKQISPSVVLTVNDAGSLSFRVSKENVNEMPNLIEYLEENSHKEVQSKRFSISEKNTKESLIKEWGVSHTSLEEVFIQVTKNHGFDYGKEEDEEIIHDDKDDKEDINIEFEDSPLFANKKPIKSFSYKALFRKNVRLQMKQKGSNCCQILTPILVLLILLVFQLLIKNELGDNANIKQFVPTFPWPLSQYDNFDFGSEFSSLDKNENLRAKELGQCWKFFLFSTDKNSVDGAGHLYENGTASGLLGRIAQQACQKYLNETFFENAFIPTFEETENQTQSNEIIYKAIEVYNENPVQNVTKPPMSNLLPDGSIRFVNIDFNQAYINYSISVNDNIFNFYHRANNFTLNFFDKIIVQKGKLAFMSMINNAFQSIANARDGEPILVHKPLSNSRFVQELPYYATANLLEIISVLGIILYPIALTIQLPVYIFVLVLEKSEKLKELMKMHGLSDISYTLINYFFFYILYTITIILFWVFGAIMGLRFFTQTNFFTLAIFFFGWGHSLVSFAFFLSSFINTKRAAVVVGYVFGLIGSLIGVIICVTIYTDDKKLPFYLNLVPQFPFIRGIYLMNTKCINQLACYGSLGGIRIEDEFAQDLIWLFADAIIFFVLHLYLDQVLPREWGVPKHPLFFLGSKVENFCSMKKGVLLRDDMSSVDLRNFKKDEDVMNEIHKVESGKISPNDYPMIISNLRKVYDAKPPKVAVKGLYLAIPKGECFGLLGENGAGKSTTISMLTGLILPTSGNAQIGGFDITTHISDVHKRIGVCPQFSVLWEDLTVRQHLEFFARLKGIESKEESGHVEKALKEFGLFKFSNRLSKDLSGGMKRRLSVAISLIGNSQIIFLDEPSTGLDPVSRRQLWKVIERAKKGRVIILTTHAMEEAELLCNRIGIVAHGEMDEKEVDTWRER